MIDISSVILDLDYIFVDVSTCEATLICLPITNNEIQKPDLGAFFKNIMVNTQLIKLKILTMLQKYLIT